MLILTDRGNDRLKIHADLTRGRKAQIVALHQALAKPDVSSIIVCDVELGNETSLKLLRVALAQYRSTPDLPIFFLTRDSSHLTETLAASLGATERMPCNAPSEQMVAAVNRLIAAYRSRRKPANPAPTEAEARVSDAKSVLSGCFDAAKRREPVSIAALENGADVVLGAIKKAKIRAWLDIVWQFDDVTYQHCLLVAGVVAAFTLKLGLTSQHQHLLSQAALVHDIGKARIPLAILNKPGALSKPEMDIVRTHAALGHGMLQEQSGISPAILDVTRHHHEFLDGTGYPDGLKGPQISGYARIATICDIYSALIERRSYKAPMAPKQAFAVLAGMAGKPDRGLLKGSEAAVADSCCRLREPRRTHASLYRHE